jgi:hypothetical protein
MSKQKKAILKQVAALRSSERQTLSKFQEYQALLRQLKDVKAALGEC